MQIKQTNLSQSGATADQLARTREYDELYDKLRALKMGGEDPQCIAVKLPEGVKYKRFRFRVWEALTKRARRAGWAVKGEFDVWSVTVHAIGNKERTTINVWATSPRVPTPAPEPQPSVDTFRVGKGKDVAFVVPPLAESTR